jgi:hypothetical protein
MTRIRTDDTGGETRSVFIFLDVTSHEGTTEKARRLTRMDTDKDR